MFDKKEDKFDVILDHLFNKSRHDTHPQNILEDDKNVVVTRRGRFRIKRKRPIVSIKGYYEE